MPAIHFTTESVAMSLDIYLAPTIKEELFFKWEIGIKQPWNFSVEIKFAVVKFSSVLIFVDRTTDENFLTSKISGITAIDNQKYQAKCWTMKFQLNCTVHFLLLSGIWVTIVIRFQHCLWLNHGILTLPLKWFTCTKFADNKLEWGRNSDSSS